MSMRAGTKGHPPEVKIQLTEQAKYEKMWAIDDYRKVAPGEQSAFTFLEIAKPLPHSTCIDFGCGTGRGALMLAMFGKMIVTMVDFAKNALDKEIVEIMEEQPDRLQWLQADLAKDVPATAAYGYCTDVMEHIPPEQVDDVLRNILKSANNVFFQIAMQDDVMGARIGEPLHLSIHPYEWWVKKFQELGAFIQWSQNIEDHTCQLYVNAWADKDDVNFEGKVNTDLEQVHKNIRKNAETEYQLIRPHPPQDTEIMLICGGPSLNDYTDEIIELRAKGMPIVTTNGTYNWAIANGMTPSMQLIIDGRKFNKRFLRPVVDDCKYVLASQCNPVLFKDLPLERTYIWHVNLADEVEDLLNELYDLWFACPGGSTVTLRGLCLLRMLGFHKIHVYGFDSCYREDEHHAYSQPENDYKAKPLPVSVGGKVFWCDPWMYSQAREFIQMVKMLGDEIELDVKGDGLIAHIIKTGAALSALEEDEE